jgi:hypothetical protein
LIEREKDRDRGEKHSRERYRGGDWSVNKEVIGESDGE